jgi:hypothetical protein
VESVEHRRDASKNAFGTMPTLTAQRPSRMLKTGFQ